MSVTLMFQGTGSDVGKSLVVAGLARALVRRGYRVAPFKPQNMSNNAAVTADGAEIGRAQALQARAARREPTADMNPVLLKPQGAAGAQVVVRGKIIGSARAREYQQWKAGLMSAVLESYERLRATADIVLVEGAGSAAEINLRANDIANMGFARRVGAPVVLVGDIDRGGVIAQLVGCKVVLDPEDEALIRGFIVNKFRGDPTLFDEGMRFIAERTGWRPLGLAPYFPDAARLPAEDAFGLRAAAPVSGEGELTIVAPLLPNIANFDDLDPLRAEPGVRFVLARPGEPLPAEARLVILPGSKATIADLAAFREAGWHIDLAAHIRRGGRVFGICGGYQMMGRRIADPQGLEGPPGAVEGLGLLDMETVFETEKVLKQVRGATVAETIPFYGYEMHAGRTEGPDCARPLLRFEDGRLDGAASADGRCAGVYVHGFFADDALRAAFLRDHGAGAADYSYEQSIEATLDGLAEHFERHLDVDGLLELAQ
ncbi:Cobyric+acid+synthase [Methylocapsa aurea]|uniref:cobyric acid synthase n=1 Tax=Methylocapsa aurea TaxID=663610 RepID=UPI003D18F5DA